MGNETLGITKNGSTEGISVSPARVLCEFNDYLKVRRFTLLKKYLEARQCSDIRAGVRGCDQTLEETVVRHFFVIPEVVNEAVRCTRFEESECCTRYFSVKLDVRIEK